MTVAELIQELENFCDEPGNENLEVRFAFMRFPNHVTYPFKNVKFDFINKGDALTCPTETPAVKPICLITGA